MKKKAANENGRNGWEAAWNQRMDSLAQAQAALTASQAQLVENQAAALAHERKLYERMDRFEARVIELLESLPQQVHDLGFHGIQKSRADQPKSEE